MAKSARRSGENPARFRTLVARRRSTMENKHLQPEKSPDDLQDDLERDPGISQSAGLFARTSKDDADLIKGENTVEGDTENDSGVGGGVNPKAGRDH
jgi:hypothetical protein